MDTQMNVLARGKTWYNGATIDTSNYQAVHLEGLQRTFNNTDPSNRLVPRNSSDVKVILVRNVSGVVLYPKEVVTWKSGYRGRRVDGKVNVTAELVAGVVDDHIGAAGVPNGDMFWLIVEGECLLKTPMSGSDFTADIAVDDLLYGLTAANSTGSGSTTTEGRFTNWGGTFSAAQTTDGTAAKIIRNSFARALSAKTTGNTNADILAYIKVV